MQLDIQAHQIQVTGALRNYIEEKFKRLAHLLGGPMDVHLHVAYGPLHPEIMATIQSYGANFFAEETQEDLYSAMDDLTHKLERQIMGHKAQKKGY